MNDVLSPIVSAPDLKHAEHLHDLTLVDVRGGQDAFERYTAGHIRGALFINLETDLSAKTQDPAAGGRHPLPDPVTFGVFLGNAGIGPNDHLLVYDDKAGANAAARFWWMLKAAGHEKIQVVDGGLKALLDAGFPLSTHPAVDRSEKHAYPIKFWKLPTADMEEVDRARTDPAYRLIDVRENYRYRGESEPIDLIAGHIPGALNIPFLSNLEENGRFRSPGALAAHFRKVIGDVDGDKVIVHCGSGVTACHTLLAMARAGLPMARLYVGSWSEWSRNNKPVGSGEGR